MTLFVSTNVGSLKGRNQLSRVNQNLDRSYQRLSSGLRISSARDDAAGLAIADRMTSEIGGLQQAQRNTADALALLQTLDSSMGHLMDCSQQIRTLTIQAMNGTNTAEDKAALGTQIYALIKEMDDSAAHTKFSGKTILDGKNDASLYGKEGTAGAHLPVYSATAMPFAQVQNGSITFQIGAHGEDTFTIEVAKFSRSATTGLTHDNVLTVMTSAFNLTHSSNATSFKGTVADDTADGILFDQGYDHFLKMTEHVMDAIQTQRSQVGAAMQRLESTMRNNDNVRANQSDARSRIRDTDFAQESAQLAQQNILQQASMTMLMQANARPQLALQLLG